MVGSIQIKIIKGCKYFYYQESKRFGKKVKTVVQECLGSEKKIIKLLRDKDGTKIKPKEIESKEFGATATALIILEEIGIIDVVDKIIPKPPRQLISNGQAFFIDTLNRCVDPSPNYKLGDWYGTTFLKRTFGISSGKLNGQNFWNWMNNFTEEKIDAIQNKILDILISKYDIDISKVIIDFTNFTTYQVKHKNNKLAQRGAAKDKKYWLRQINIALAATTEGIPLMHSTYGGNINDPTHYKKFFKAFTRNYAELLTKCEKVCFIHDKGMNNKQSIARCDNNKNYHFIAALRPSSCQEFMLIPLDKFEDPYKDEGSEKNKGQFLTYRTNKTLFGKERTVIIAYYEPTANKKFHTLCEKIPIAFDELEELKTKLNTNKWNTKKEVEKKISKIIGKPSIHGLVKFKVKGKKDDLSLDYWIDDEKLQYKIETFGKNFLFTDDESLETKDIVTSYFKEKNTIEVCNKLLKSSKYSRIKPMGCWTDIQMRAHVFSCVVSLLVGSLIQKRLKENNIKSVVQEPCKKRVPIMSTQEALDHLRNIREEILFYPNEMKAERIITRMNNTQLKLFEIFDLKKYI